MVQDLHSLYHVSRVIDLYSPRNLKKCIKCHPNSIYVAEVIIIYHGLLFQNTNHFLFHLSLIYLFFLSQTQTHTQLTKKTYLDTDSQFLSHPDRKAQTEFPCILLHRFILYVVYRAQNTNNFFSNFQSYTFLLICSST